MSMVITTHTHSWVLSHKAQHPLTALPRQRLLQKVITTHTHKYYPIRPKIQQQQMIATNQRIKLLTNTAFYKVLAEIPGVARDSR